LQSKENCHFVVLFGPSLMCVDLILIPGLLLNHTWRQLYHKPIRLNSLAILCDHEIQRCVEDISWLCILIQDELSTHLLHCALYSAWQTSCLFSSKTIPQFTWSWMSTWNQFRPLSSSSSSKSYPLEKKTNLCLRGSEKIGK